MASACLLKKKLGIEATPKALNDLKLKNANDEIIHDLRPANDGTYYGLLDTVTGSFYYNENNSYYTCGNF